jgi:protein-S-isoprenylcysteine O-methyltransferase Ste14
VSCQPAAPYAPMLPHRCILGPGQEPKTEVPNEATGRPLIRVGLNRTPRLDCEDDEMHSLGERTLGIAILLLLGMLLIVKQIATGSLLKDKPQGNLWIWLTHIFSLFFLLIANPLAAILLLTRHLEAFDPTHLAIAPPHLLTGMELAGVLFHLTGYLIMAWALITLGHNYQVGGSAPRLPDKLVTVGPCRLVRHPVYTAALCISLGLGCLIQSLAYFILFYIYLVLILLLIPVEEHGLRRAYGEQYVAYQQTVKELFPFLH